MNHKLFNPVTVGDVELNNRIVMAPMTRSRAAQPNDVPTELNALYYGQRASAGLIITEGTQVSDVGKGYSFTPGIYSEEQIQGWALATQAVHEKGGKIAAQLWHVGRMSHSSLHTNHEQPIAPSAIQAKASVFIANEKGEGAMVPAEMPRAMDLDDIQNVKQEFIQAAQNAVKAGFDLVEVHAANGYLFDQFLSTDANQRTDNYGGSVENRARFLLETVDALIEAIGAGRVGLRLSPWGTINGMTDQQPEEITLYLAEQLQKRNIAYIHLAEWDMLPHGDTYPVGFREKLRSLFTNTLIVCGNYSLERAETILDKGLVDAVAFGRPFISNPDLVERLQLGHSLAPAKSEYFYGGDATGYTDYPTAQ